MAPYISHTFRRQIALSFLSSHFYVTSMIKPIKINSTSEFSRIQIFYYFQQQIICGFLHPLRRERGYIFSWPICYLYFNFLNFFRRSNWRWMNWMCDRMTLPTCVNSSRYRPNIGQINFLFDLVPYSIQNYWNYIMSSPDFEFNSKYVV